MADKNSDINSFPSIWNDDDSNNVYHALQAFVEDDHHMDQDVHRGFGDPQQHIEESIGFTGSHLITNLGPYHTYPDHPQFERERLPDDEWSQQFAGTNDYVQVPEEDGIIPVNRDENITPDHNTVRHDILTQVSPPEPLHGGIVHPPPTLHEAAHFPEPTVAFDNANSMPSSSAATTATTLRTPSPPNSQGHNPNVSGSPYHCADCGTSSKTKRDHERHLATKKHQKKTSGSNGSGSNSGSGSESGSLVPGFHCLAPDCEYSRGGKTFTREDNLWRHMKNVHPVKALA